MTMLKRLLLATAIAVSATVATAQEGEGEAAAQTEGQDAGVQLDPPAEEVGDEEGIEHFTHFPIRNPKQVDWTFDGPFGKFDRQQLQRGFQVYREVCASCH